MFSVGVRSATRHGNFLWMSDRLVGKGVKILFLRTTPRLLDRFPRDTTVLYYCRYYTVDGRFKHTFGSDSTYSTQAQEAHHTHSRLTEDSSQHSDSVQLALVMVVWPLSCSVLLSVGAVS